MNVWNFSLLFHSFTIFLVLGAQKVKWRVGHIGTKENGEMLELIMEMARRRMLAEGVLDDGLDVEVVHVEGCGSSFEGVAAAAELYHVRKVDAFFGPYCTKELSPVATMASYWNVPIFAYTATSSEFSPAHVFKTLIRTSFQSIDSISAATAAFLAAHNLRKVAIVSNVGVESFERVQSMEAALRARRITVTRRIMIEETQSAEQIVESGVLAELSDNARVIIPLFSSSSRDVFSVFRNASALSSLLLPPDVLTVHPLIASSDPSAFFGKQSQSAVKTLFPDTVQIYDSAGFTDDLLDAFMHLFDGARRVYIDERALLNYVALYESFCVFARLVRLQKTRRRQSDDVAGDVADGRAFWSLARGASFDGIVGNITFDAAAQRIGSFGAFYVDSKRDQISRVAAINSTETTNNCNEVICTEFTVTDLVTKYWPSGALPDADPECGFRGEHCDYTWNIVVATIAVILVTLTVLLVWLRRFCETRDLEKMPWRIRRDDVQLFDEEQTKSVISLNSVTTKMSSQVEAKLVKNHAIIGVNTHAVYDFYEQRQAIKFKRDELVLLTKMKQLVHDNVNPFLGVSFNERSELLLLWKYCSRGTLQDVIYSEKFAMDEKFHGAFVRDITLGLEYLHSSPVGFHGGVCAWTALIDKNWMVKLTDYAIGDPLRRWEKHGRINGRVENESEKMWQKAASLYVPPEMRLANETNRTKRADQKWQRQSVTRRQQADIYAFGVLIYEILFRSLPFDDRLDLTELAQKAAEGEKIQKPAIQRNKKLGPDMIALLQDTWSDHPDMRPTIRRVRLATEVALKTKGSLVDSMMRMMEEYANNLEKLVGDRTRAAEEANLRAERLLFQLLPRDVAIELKAGRTVPPTWHPSATVMFSDIAGFTKLCSTSTPIEVVNLLNKLYSEFDTVINRHDSYKVETIGDAYMVVSGVPTENGRRHVANIAMVTLEMVELLKEFEVPHRRGTRLTIRLGFASGAVAAAVVGLNAPRYCLFGETVNIASIMESSGEGGRVQITESSKKLLELEYPEFIVEIRGIHREIKQEDFVTFWLIGKDEDYFKKKTGNF